ncbi:MAG: Lrp/AsnC family transcriptional regulator [Halobacteriaceae archaeon]
MTDAYVKIVSDPGAVSQAARTVANFDEVSDAHVVTGEYDIIAQLELSDDEDLPVVVGERIHGVPGVIDTETHVAFEP